MAEGSNLEALISLASEDSSDKRRDLLRSVTDLFFEETDSYSENEIELFGDILGKVAFDVEMEVRQQLSERMADFASAPPNLIKRFANDAIEVAKPILERSGVLNEEDLLEVIREAGQQHLLAITKRQDVSEEISEALVNQGNDNVVASLLENDDASISRGSMEKVIDRAEDSDVLHAPIVNRKTMPADLLNEVFFIVSSELRNQILKINENMDPEQLNKLLKQREANHSGANNVEASNMSDAEKLIVEKEKSKELNEQFLVKLLQNRHMPEFLFGLARLTDIDVRTARRIILDRTCESLAVTFKAHHFDRSTFSTIIMLIDPKNTRSVGQTERLLSLYNKMPVETAQRTMRFWRVRKAALSSDSTANAA